MCWQRATCSLWPHSLLHEYSLPGAQGRARLSTDPSVWSWRRRRPWFAAPSAGVGIANARTERWLGFRAPVVISAVAT